MSNNETKALPWLSALCFPPKVTYDRCFFFSLHVGENIRQTKLLVLVADDESCSRFCRLADSLYPLTLFIRTWRFCLSQRFANWRVCRFLKSVIIVLNAFVRRDVRLIVKYNCCRYGTNSASSVRAAAWSWTCGRTKVSTNSHTARRK